MPRDPGPPLVWSTPLRTRFRGLDRRDGVLLRGDAGWGELSPFWDYDDAESATWLRAAREAADVGWPSPVRETVPVNVTVPAVGPEQAREIVLASGGCATAKVKVAQRLPGGASGPGGLEALDVEVARVAAGSVDELDVEQVLEGARAGRDRGRALVAHCRVVRVQVAGSGTVDRDQIERLVAEKAAHVSILTPVRGSARRVASSDACLSS